MHVYMYQSEVCLTMFCLVYMVSVQGKKYFKGRAIFAQSHGLTLRFTNLKPVFHIVLALNVHKVCDDLACFMCQIYLTKSMVSYI